MVERFFNFTFTEVKETNIKNTNMKTTVTLYSLEDKPKNSLIINDSLFNSMLFAGLFDVDIDGSDSLIGTNEKLVEGLKLLSDFIAIIPMEEIKETIKIFNTLLYTGDAETTKLLTFIESCQLTGFYVKGK